MKKLYFIVAFVVMTQVVNASVVFNYGNFIDVTNQNVDVLYLANQGIVEGNGGGEVELNRDLNRAEALTLYARYFDIEPTLESECSFSDVATEDWYAGYVLAMCNEGMVNGYPDGTFKPANTMNRAEALKILGSALNVQPQDSYDYLPSDVDGDKWYSPFAYYFVNRNITPLYDGEFRPAMQYVRGDLIRDLYRLHLINSLGEFRYLPELDPTVQMLDVSEEEME